MNAIKKLISFSVVVWALLLQVEAQPALPVVVSGKIERIANFSSKYVVPRNIDIWLPNGYPASGKYVVLYMHDGQMLYDPDQSWNKQAWNVDDVASRLMAGGEIKPFIVVGIWNSGQMRHPDYFPQKPFEAMPQAARDTVIDQLQRTSRTRDSFKPQSDNYLKFITEELMPYINANYSVYTDSAANTFVAGSSMGGLISMYALCEYPDVFGGAACLSTHWVGTFTPENNPVPDAFLNYLNHSLPNPQTHRIYFDCGDQTLDAWYPEIQKRVDRIMTAKGYTDKNWLTRYFPGADHSEKSWNARLDIPLRFLFEK